MAEALSAKFSIIHMDVGILLDVGLDIVHIPEEIMQLLRRRIESQEEETSFNISSIWTAESLHLYTCTGLDIYSPLLSKLDNIGHLQLSLNY